MVVELPVLTTIATWMRVDKVRRFMGYGLEIELHDSAFAPPPAPPVSEKALTRDDKLICRCGHSLETEHNDAGCLYGCGIDLCRSED